MVPLTPATWRLIRSAAADGATNMAIDEAILRAIAAGTAPPTLRFYAWEPATVSLGRAQAAADVDRDAVRESGFGLVRRPTGGKAILHVDELTYSVVAPQEEPRVSGSVVESYRRVSTGLVKGLENLGVVDARADRGVAGGPANGPVCFEVPSHYEITSGGRKLVGSAQMRSHGVVLQHGAVPLHGDIARICAVLSGRPDRERVRARATTLREALDREVTWDEAVGAMMLGFSQALHLRLVPGELAAMEQGNVEELRLSKYATDAWTFRV
jgi:lipoate-protein ligase A